ncbi:hypothetical protein KXD40_009132 [Peronospora effusa]|nr:hypothetical protein KXD40_009132 [Peronospora effusa]
MMLIVIALIAWSAVTEASPMPVHVIRSVKPATWNMTNTPISGTSVSMNSSYYTYVPEERTAPVGIVDLLKEFHASRKEDQQIENLPPQIEAMNTHFTDLIRAKENRELSEEDFILKWEKYVKSKFPMNQQIVSKVIFVTLASLFQGDDLPRLLVAGTKTDTMNHIALELLDLQLEKWAEMESDPKKVFELLFLSQTNGNPIESVLFPKWVNFVKSRYHGDSEKANEHMLSVLTKHFKGDDSALAKALIERGRLSKKNIATTLLNLQINNWVNDGRDEAEIFKFLELQEPSGNPFESPIFTQWVTFVKAKYPWAGDFKDQRKNMMFDYLAKHLSGDNLAEVLVAKAKSTPQKSKIKDVAASMLHLQAEKWARDKITDENVFNLLQLQGSNGNPLESPFFSQWFDFAMTRYGVSKKAYKATLDILSSYFQSKIALVSYLERAKTSGKQTIAAQKLLDCQINEWKEDEKNAAYVFDILGLRLTESKLFDSPVISTWVDFVKSISSNDVEATNTMLSVLKLTYKDDLNSILNDGRNAKNKKMRPVAKSLQDLNEGPPKRQNDSDVNEPPAKRQKEGDHDLNEPPAKRQKEFDFDLNEPPAKRQKEYWTKKRDPELIYTI